MKKLINSVVLASISLFTMLAIYLFNENFPIELIIGNVSILMVLSIILFVRDLNEE